MAYARFDLQNDLPWRNYTSEDQSVAVILKDGGPHEVIRRQVARLSLRRWQWAMPQRTNTASASDQRQAIDAFLVVARKFSVEAFLLHDPKDPRQTGVALGTGDGSTTVFSLPTTRTAETFRHYPFDTSSVLTYPTVATVVKVNGIAVSATVQTDARTVTLASAAGTSGLAVTVDYDFYRLCIFSSNGLSWSPGGGSNYVSAMPGFEEIIRD